MRQPKWQNRSRSGRHICVPDAETKEFGNHLIAEIKRRWSPPVYFFHCQKGGHIQAIKLHVGKKYFCRADLKSFYSHIKENRIRRHLKRLSFPKGLRSQQEAAYCSTVPHPDQPKVRVLPFGFPQSPILASIALQGSILGAFLEELYQSPSHIVSVYMDDIIISTNSLSSANEAYETLRGKVTRSNFEINTSKCSGVVTDQVEAFNIIADAKGIKLTEKRYMKFKKELINGSISVNKQTGILNYVRSINLKQYEELLQIIS